MEFFKQRQATWYKGCRADYTEFDISVALYREERGTASGESAIPKVHLGYSGFLEQLGSSDSREGMMLQ